MLGDCKAAVYVAVIMTETVVLVNMRTQQEEVVSGLRPTFKIGDIVKEAQYTWPNAVAILSGGVVLDEKTQLRDVEHKDRLLVFTFDNSENTVFDPPQLTDEDIEEMNLAFDEAAINKVPLRDATRLSRACPRGFDDVMKSYLFEKLNRDPASVEAFFQRLLNLT